MKLMGAKTYNCVNGTCIEIDGEWGILQVTKNVEMNVQI